MDIAARHAEAKSIVTLFENFGGLGLSAYSRVSSGLFNALDQADGHWVAAINAMLAELSTLASGTALQAQVAALSAKYAKRAAALVDISGLAADAYFELFALSAPDRQAEIEELRAAGVSQRRIDILYPFNIEEHLPGIAQHALHGPQAAMIAPLLRNAETYVAANLLLPASTVDASRTSRAYIRATYGPWNSETSSQYENVVDAWAVLLTFMHEVASKSLPFESARTKSAKVMKHQREIASELADLITGA